MTTATRSPMRPTGLLIFLAPATSSTRRTATGVKADRRSPAGLGLDASEDRRTLTLAGATIHITCIMSMCGCPLTRVMQVIDANRGLSRRAPLNTSARSLHVPRLR